MIDDEVARNAIAEAIRTAVDRTVQQQVRRGIAQEAQITSKIGSAIEAALDQKTFGGYRLRVAAQDLSDRGPGALEEEYGSDMYIGIQTIEDHPKSKGIIVQSKIVPPGRKRIVRSADLIKQCRKMERISKIGSYVWVYDAEGVGVSTTQEVLNMKKYSRIKIGSDTVYDQIGAVLECSKGDPDIGLPILAGAYTAFDDEPAFDRALGEMLRTLKIRSGVSVSVRPPSRVRHRITRG